METDHQDQLHYLRALQDRFAPPEEGPEAQAAERCRRELAQRLDREDRAALLRLADLECACRDRETLRSFTAGFKLALGLAGELRLDGLYSYEEELERPLRD